MVFNADLSLFYVDVISIYPGNLLEGNIIHAWIKILRDINACVDPTLYLCTPPEVQELLNTGTQTAPFVEAKASGAKRFLLPVHMSEDFREGHWLYIVVDTEAACIVSFDSMNRGRMEKKFYDKLRERLNVVFETPGNFMMY